jgi:N-acetylmuramic acid 6-phosphate etherase
MLVHLTGRSPLEARDALLRARGSVKLAVLLLKGYRDADAESALIAACGNLREALARLEAPR